VNSWSYWPTLLLPIATWLYLFTIPHGGLTFAAVLAFLLSLVAADRLSPRDREPPAGSSAGRGLRPLLFGLAASHLVGLAMFLHAVAEGRLQGVDLCVAAFLVGVNSGYSAIVVAHELIHQPRRVEKALGQLLLTTVLYGHFFIEHLRGHHRRAATDEDPASARFGESFVAFLPRSIAGQLQSAWWLERTRIDLDAAGAPLRAWLRSPLVASLALQVFLVASVARAFGGAAVLAMVGQAVVAVLCLEAANYVEHWGLRREGKAVLGSHSWDTDSWFSRRALLSLPRHADHHLHPGRRHYELALREESPKLPFGHFAAICVALVANRRFQASASSELCARSLGPFAGQRRDPSRESA
jgi:alkane 1-monooxygenase